MQHWEEQIKRANAFFAQGNVAQAEADYKLACTEAAKAFDTWFDFEAVVAAYVVSHQNIAELYFNTQRIADALTAYIEIYRTLQKHRSYSARNTTERHLVDATLRRVGTELLSTLKAKGIQSKQSAALLTTYQAVPFSSINQFKEETLSEKS